MRNDNMQLGINDRELNDVILGLDTDLDSISSILSQIQMTFYNTKEYFKGDVAEEIRDKFEVYNQQISTLKDNLKTYTADLLVVKEFAGNVDAASSRHIQAADDVAKNKKEIAITDNEQELINVSSIKNRAILDSIRK